MAVFQERLNNPREGVRMGMDMQYPDVASLKDAKGEVFIQVVDVETGEVLDERHVPNVITLDASLLAAILFNNPSARNGANMLAVGTGATGAVLSPDAPDSKQRKLNAEIERKPWSSYTFRDAGGNAVAIPTNIIDWTVIYDEAEAVGPLDEMGILSTISANPAIKNDNPNTYPTRDVTVDVSTLDILVNYLSFAVISKPATARLTITWRITF